MENVAFQERFLAEIEKHRKIIYKVCHLYTDTDTDFSDLYQEIVLHLWKGFANFQGKSKISTWIYKVAINTAIYKLRQDKIKIPFDPLKQDHYDIPDVNDREEKEKMEMLKNLIGQLTEIEKAIITLHLDEYSYNDISDIIGITKTNVATKVHRIKKKLSLMLNSKNH
jgi:RNA polymerase sigma-70 factor (ECF subfamily)